MPLYKLLSVLLGYPASEVISHIGELEDVAKSTSEFTDADRGDLQQFFDWAKQQSELDLQTYYVKTFDLTPDNALYLTHHLFEEDDKQRGPTLINLSQHFRSKGYDISENELPDYLPLILEFVSTNETELDARKFLAQSVHALEIVEQNLTRIESPYAALMHIVVRHGQLTERAA